MDDDMDKTLPTVSVVIPAYNEEKNLPHTLESLNSQIRKPFEIIVADNNSKDNTATVAQDLGARVVRVTTQGYVYAIKEGMHQAKGEVIAVIDADTTALPTWIDEITKAFTDDSVVGATGGITIKPETLAAKLNNILYSLFLIINFRVGLPHLVGFNMAVRRSALIKVDGIDVRYIMGPDVELGLRLKKHGKVVFVQSMKVVPSMRRWENNSFRAFYEYAKSYVFTVWLRRPAFVKQSVIR